MAKAKLIPPQFPEVELSLSGEEAQFILDLLQNVGGPSHNTRRKHVGTIAGALEDIGLTPMKGRDSNGSIYFTKETI